MSFWPLSELSGAAVESDAATHLCDKWRRLAMRWSPAWLSLCDSNGDGDTCGANAEVVRHSVEQGQ